ncbi:MAG TPA: formimidoylglutamase, partial [Anaerolineae bacterium]
PQEIRRCLYRLALGSLPAQLRLFDLGDTVIQPTLEDTHALHQRLVAQIIRDGKRLIVLGGGNDISYPDCSGLAQAREGVIACNIDAHFDVRADHPRNSGTPYRQLIEEGFLQPDKFYEIGYQPFSNSPVYEAYLQSKGAHLLSRNALRRAGAGESIRRVLGELPADGFSLFWGFDMDVVCTADAPGVSAPNPTGLSGAELCEIAQLAGAHPHTRLVEFSEVNPRFDIDQRTSRLAAVAIWHFLSALSLSPADGRV